MNNIYRNISKRLQEKLPGETSHEKMLPPGRKLKATPSDLKQIKYSSVMVLLFQEEKELMVTLIKRPKHMKHHAGQIAIPGGRIETNETAVETALRETREEIGIYSNQIEVLGQLSKLYVEVSSFQIQPFVGWLKQRPTINNCPNEVEKTLFFPIRKLKTPHDTIELDTLTGKLLVPAVHFEGEIIWGATAMILSELYDLIESHLN